MVEERVRALRQGDPDGRPGSVEVGAVTSPAQLEKIERHVSSAIDAGARALTGGARSNGNGQFFPPTVLVDVTPDMDCIRDETFGPTLPIVRVRDADEAVALANDSPFGLGATVFTRDAAARRGAWRAGSRPATWRSTTRGPTSPCSTCRWAAGRTRGWARATVPEGIRKYCRQQTIVVAPPLPQARAAHVSLPAHGRRSASCG